MDGIDLAVAVFDANNGVLRYASGDEQQLRPQSAQVLRELVNHSGNVVSKTQLTEAVWGNIAVTENSLSQCIADIRRALGDEQRKIIQTLPRLGYRLIVPAPPKGQIMDDEPVTPLEQTPIRFATSSDGVRLAWTASGTGLPMLKAPTWVSNIEMEAHSLIFTEFYRWLGDRVRLVRFDQRGTSLSDRVQGQSSLEDMVEDMRAVADAAGLDRFLLYGSSQGAAFSIAFAHRYPKRVLGIMGRGGFGRGRLVSGDESERLRYEGAKALIEAGWNESTPEYRRFFTNRLIPDCSPAIAQEFDEIQRHTCDAALMLANLELISNFNVEEMAKTVSNAATARERRPYY